ncbi:MAG TPA: tetratricopeptide repeat protein [Candidatus Limnocylindria bacterium]|jgi:tetratricopeptide (TPR) repeat protein|nr:tetratricopeptide repeat protein [Candidatus Limnocylindria bacterium]
MPRTKLIARPTAEDAELAKRIGSRIREARLRAGLTQQQLAGERYTKAYVSALETGIARPSMVALSYLSERLHLSPSHFLDTQNPAWGRLQTDLQLASGEWQAAADGYADLLDHAQDDQARAEVLRGRAEALARMDRGKDAVGAASEAVRLFLDLGREADAALSRYWLAYGLYLSDNEADARSLLRALLEQVRGGLKVEPDFEMRLLVALASVDSRDGQHERSLAYLEEARGLTEDLDDRRRATFLVGLAISYRELGDIEAAIRVGTQALGLFHSAGALLESASIENDLALAYLAAGNTARAGEMVGGARTQAEGSGDQRLLAAILETEAQVALANGARDEALELAGRARALGRSTGNQKAELAAMLTEARALRDGGQADAAQARYHEAATLARDGQAAARIREVLREWADLRASIGDHRGAYELTSEALGA